MTQKDPDFAAQVQLYAALFTICLRGVYFISIFQLLGYLVYQTEFSWFPVLSIITVFLLSVQFIGLIRKYDELLERHGLFEEDVE